MHLSSMWLIALLAVGSSVALPAGEDAQAETIKMESENTGDKYSFAWVHPN